MCRIYWHPVVMVQIANNRAAEPRLTLEHTKRKYFVFDHYHHLKSFNQNGILLPL